MKFRTKILAGMLSLILFASVAIAGLVYDRAVVTLGTTTGTVTWTNDYKYAAVNLKRIAIFGSAVAVDTVTVSRVTSDNTYTQTVVAIVLASNAGASNTLPIAYMKNSDKLTFASTATTGATAMIEFEVQQH